MRWPAFVGPSYQSQSLVADVEKLVNWYPEHIEMPGATTSYAHYPTPGQQSFVTTTDVGGRALYTMAGRTHAVMGGGIHEVFATQTTTRRGSVAQDNNPATISYNGATGNQLFVTSGTNGYLVNLTTNAVTQVLTGDATMGDMLDGFFIAFDAATPKFRLSNLNDGTTWSGTQFALRSSQPDPWKAMVVIPPDIWLIGERTGDIWYDAGTSPFPFALRTGLTIRYGIIAPFSLAKTGASALWLSQNADGAGIVVQTSGYAAQPVSNKAVETAMASYARTASISDAEGFVWQFQGHTFYILTFPSANATWVYDLTTSLWFEMGTWSSANNRFDAWHPRVHTYAFGKHLFGDRTTGTISQADLTFGSELDGSVIRRLRIPPPLQVRDRTKRLFIERFELILEPGLGLSTGQGSDPQVMLRKSTDAKTWSSERMASAGAIGRYTQSVVWNRCGSSPDLWVPEITVSDPIPWRVLGADVQGTGFLLPTQAQQAA